MAKPTNTIKGFIEITWDSKLTLLSIENILAIRKDSDRATIILKASIDRYSSTSETLDLSYEDISTLIREASR